MTVRKGNVQRIASILGSEAWEKPKKIYFVLFLLVFWESLPYIMFVLHFAIPNEAKAIMCGGSAFRKKQRNCISIRYAITPAQNLKTQKCLRTEMEYIMDYDDYETDMDKISAMGSISTEGCSILQYLDCGIVTPILITPYFDEDTIGKEIVNAPWQVVILTDDKKDFYRMFKTEQREPRDIFYNAADRHGIKIVPSATNLPVVRFAPQDTSMSWEDTIRECMNDVWTELNLQGVIFANSIPEIYSRLLYQSIKNNKQSLYLLGDAQNDCEQEFVAKGIAIELPKNAPDLWDKYTNEKEIKGIKCGKHLHVSNQILSIPTDLTSAIEKFASLLTIEEAAFNPCVENVPDDFCNFLEYSVSGFPSWYCYNPAVGYHLEREIEAEIQKKLVKAMEDADHENNTNTILLMGQAFSGKTNILCSIAWWMFNKHSYPVIYIPSSFPPSALYHNENAMTGRRDNGQGDSMDKGPLADFLYHLEKIENRYSGVVVPTLIVWDSSCRQTEDLEAIEKLLKQLRNAGRQVQMICSSYNCNIESYSRSFDPIMIEGKLKEKEKERLLTLLHTKGGFSHSEIEVLRNSNYCKKDNPFFIATLYYLFLDIRTLIQNHISIETEAVTRNLINEYIVKIDRRFSKGWKDLWKEVEHRFSTPFKSYEDDSVLEKEFEGQLKKTLDCLAFCTFNGCSLPLNIVLRLLKTSMDLPTPVAYSAIQSHPLLREETDIENISRFAIRSSLESKILLDAASDRNSDYYPKLFFMVLDNVNISKEHEAQILRKLIRAIGPNSRLIDRKYWLWQTDNTVFPDIWNKLKEKREEIRGIPAMNLLPQEFSLIREFFIKNHPKDFIPVLEDARDTAQNAINSLAQKSRYLNWHCIMLKTRIMVEYWAISKVLINERPLNERAGLFKRFYDDNHKDYEEQEKKHNNNNYIRNALIDIVDCYYKHIDHNTFCSMPKNEEADIKIILIEQLCRYYLKFRKNKTSNCSSNQFSAEDNIISFRHNGEDNNDIRDTISAFNDGLLETRINDNESALFVKMVKENIRMETCLDLSNSIESSNKIAPGQFSSATYSSEFVLCKNRIKTEFLNFYKKYLEGKEETIKKDPLFVDVLIRSLWRAYTGGEIIPKSGKQRLCPKLSITASTSTNNNEAGEWNSIYKWCSFYNQYTEVNCRNAEITYLHALSAICLRKYSEGNRLLRENLCQRKNQIGNWYMICDESGAPRLFQSRGRYVLKNEDGKLIADHVTAADQKDNVGIELSQLFLPRNYYKWNQVKEEDLSFWISISFSGIEAVPPDSNLLQS